MRLRRHIGIGLFVAMAALVVIVLRRFHLTSATELEYRSMALSNANLKLQVQMSERERVEAALRRPRKAADFPSDMPAKID
jgi:hypothetical protein